MNLETQPSSRLIVALDFDSLAPALRFAEKIADLVAMFKIGSQLFTAEGPGVVAKIAALGAGVFLDLKFHDIPNTVAGAVLATTGFPGLQMVTVHSLGGGAMLRAAAQAIHATQPLDADRPRLLAVTLLTSLDSKSMHELGLSGSGRGRAIKLARLARQAGVDGVVASMQEARAIRKACGRDFLIVTPGVRPKEYGARRKRDDQARTATAAEAIRAGADYLVVGRPIIAASDPRAAAQAILSEIETA